MAATGGPGMQPVFGPTRPINSPGHVCMCVPIIMRERISFQTHAIALDQKKKYRYLLIFACNPAWIKKLTSMSVLTGLSDFSITFCHPWCEPTRRKIKIKKELILIEGNSFSEEIDTLGTTKINISGVIG